ncbi:hypothetical protein KAU33_08870 [Candidatus Dependentiae bacterium]|nr:hypothetical protein [Candidatus Dependentiae bacterium]
MRYLVDGRVIPDSQIDCLIMTMMEPLSKTGNCMRCAMKQFASTRTDYSSHVDYKPREIVDKERCPWYLMMEERDRALSKNKSLQETVSDAIYEIDILKEILEKSSEDYSI